MELDIHPVVREYCDDDEEGWVRCRVLAFLDSAYYDDVYQEKDHYSSDAIELVAEIDGQIVGLLDIEYKMSVSNAGMLWHLAVHPDFRRHGIARLLLEKAVKEARKVGLVRLEAWTRDDGQAERWYLSQGFRKMQTYYHVYIDSDEATPEIINSQIPQMKPATVFAHYLGDDKSFLEQFKRVYCCSRYSLAIE
jgi:ribosomal protein S18 acetylase RimI-like enzyme